MNKFGSLLLLCAAVDGVSPANGAAVGQHKDANNLDLSTRMGRLMRKAHASSDGLAGTEEDHMTALVEHDGHISYSSEMVDSNQGDEFDYNASLVDLNDDSPPDINDDFELPPFPDQSLLEDNATDYEASGLSCSSISRLSGNTNHKATPDSRIVASSYWHNRADHGKGQMWRTRLNQHGTTWCAHHNRKNQWVQWDFGGDKIVTRSLNMGRHNCHQWVKSYKILYKSSKHNWKWHPRTYSGGNWRWCRVNTLSPPVLARKIRIYVQTWHNHISMRADWDGCAPSVPGPKGAAGARGANGAKGSPGARGANGARGSNGARGPPGPRGRTGAKGAHGVKGSTGARGVHGIKGAKGNTGAKGVGGPKGATGARGTTGVKGVTGATGKVGHIGPQGSKGDKGDTPKAIDCVWADWAEYSDCTKSCGKTDPGTQVRARSFKVDPQNGGKDCEGKMFETKQCNVKECPTTTTTTTTKPAKSSSVPLRANCLVAATLLAAASNSLLS